ncbi:MAG: CHASE domain-containing protein [Aliarcobacter sp.]|nr:CHASE domain-containing protein [Aliarcobacter sp.]
MNYLFRRIYLLILFLGIAISLILGYYTYKNNLEKKQIQFNSLTKNVLQQIENRMNTYKEVLYSGLGFFEASDNVTREEWHIFTSKLQLKDYFPGIQGLGYSLLLRENELQKNIEDIRAQGFPEYDIYPKGKRDLYTSVLYIEPFDNKNKKAFGYDMFSEEKRHYAMNRTIETGLATLSGKVKLIQEKKEDEENGFLLYTPLYKKNFPLESINQRYHAIEGFVYAVFKTKDFINGALGNFLETIDIKMYDGTIKDENTLLFNSNTQTKLNNPFIENIEVELDGHKWTFEITAKDIFLDLEDTIYPFVFTFLGFLITLLIAQLMKRQGEIEILKDDALLNVSQGVMVTNSERKIVYTNKAFEDLTGYSRKLVYGKQPNFLQGKDTLIESIEAIKENLKKSKPFECEILNYKKDGTAFWNRLSVTPIFDEKNNIKRYIGIQNDITDKKLLEKNILFEKNLIENILSNTSAIIALIDMKGVMVKLNEYGKNFVGYTQEEISSEPYFWKKFIPEEMRENVTKIIYEAKQGKLIDKKQNAWISNNAEKKIFEWSNQLIKDSNTNPEYIITVGIDVTNDVIAQEQHKKYQKQLELSAQISGLAFWELNLKTNIFTFNDIYYNLLGTSVEYENGYQIDVETYFNSFLPPKSQKIVMDVIYFAFTKDKDYQNTFEYEMRRRDGVILQILVNYFITYDTEGNPNKAYGTKYNLTKQKEKEKVLIEAKQNAQDLLYEQNSLLSLFDKGDTVLFKWENHKKEESKQDSHWKVVYVSKSVEKLLGYNISEFTSNTIKYISCIFKDDVAIVKQEVAEAIKENKDFFIHKPYRVFTKDKKIKWVIDYTVTQKDKNGKVIYFIGYIIDITEQKELEYNLIQAKQKAENASKAKTEFLANMSHEIRTPLNGIIGLTNLILETPLNDMQKSYLSKSITSSKALLHVINDILDYSKIEVNKIELEHIPFELDKMLHQLSNLFMYEAQNKGINLDCNIAPLIHNNLIGDPFRINQILINLVGNAIKFTAHGFINIDINLEDTKENTIKLSFNVKDTGIGISKDKQKKLFQDFTQIDASNTREYGGTGLGLVISQKLAQLMGGEISVVSEEKKGSTFSFTSELEFIQKDYDFLSQDLRNKKVLIIDDKIEIRKNIEKTLKTFDLNTITCNDTKTALKILNQEDIDYIIIEWQLSEKNGIEFAKEIEFIYKNKHIKIIILSSFDKKEKLINAAKESGININRLLIKPFSSSTLLNILVNNSGIIIGENQSAEKLLVKAKILLVEDNEINQLVAKQNLENFGIEVHTALNGAIAVEKVQKESFDMIIMDLQMPIMDGFEASKKIREFADTPIIALSAAVMQEDLKMTQEAGMNEHLAKPIDIEKLKEVLIKYLNTSVEEIIVENKIGTEELIEGVNLEELFARLNYNKELAYKMLISFSKDKKNIIKELDSLDINSKEFRVLMHNLKGLSGNLSLYDVFKYTDRIYNSNILENKIKFLSKLKDSLNKVINAINEKINKNIELKDNVNIFLKEEILTNIKKLNYDISQGAFISQDEKHLIIDQVKQVQNKNTAKELEGYLSNFDYKNAQNLLEKIIGDLV